ncbi:MULTISPECIES: hypothetical protein [Allobacillus]|uniref:Uncharacterized protein n=1 Tax=Allobacillus halotolerans TaxID=570278 RepID=A0ABS6GNS5_9BACI|nr:MULTISPECIES: hypothetical protein [Allobacillus]MBU6080774.1 hypothetical protein [Allobacillus halotolerans]
MFLFFTERTFVIGQEAVQTWVSVFLNGMAITVLLLFIIQWLILGKSLFKEIEEKKAM